MANRLGVEVCLRPLIASLLMISSLSLLSQPYHRERSVCLRPLMASLLMISSLSLLSQPYHRERSVASLYPLICYSRHIKVFGDRRPQFTKL
eukprot:TRINITY_DN45577_c0_g1_i1.p1 TRINITY_DN45577_c0_g1~~TRINITY_DN45577_c0_g1_i1.p1  ORF type:complete len:102 (-),score=2.30 TRINITY_DN45577_c0_g1_i1:125-400(-)